ncbi:hypothetical protein BLOT_010717 [Blomia tropicalis]|nr:hypothetical protein BLOT_010717 [Blomia tropicalis]
MDIPKIVISFIPPVEQNDNTTLLHESSFIEQSYYFIRKDKSSSQTKNVQKTSGLFNEQKVELFPTFKNIEEHEPDSMDPKQQLLLSNFNCQSAIEKDNSFAPIKPKPSIYLDGEKPIGLDKKVQWKHLSNEKLSVTIDLSTFNSNKPI